MHLMDCPCLRVVTYHYVRDLPRTRFPRLKGMLTNDFQRQVASLAEQYEMATWESAQEFLAGRYAPNRDLCLLTFDDGLKEHAVEVTPILAERRIQGLFFLPTASLEDHKVLSVHKNHFLMAGLGFDVYRRELLASLAEITGKTEIHVDMEQAQRTYRFDVAEVAAFKYLVNFRLSEQVRRSVVSELFVRYFGEEEQFARELYVSWDQARQMQSEGMLLGGHSHQHVALATLDEQGQTVDLATNLRLLRKRSRPQPAWPFSYPYGNPADSFNEATISVLSTLGYCCAFTTEAGANRSPTNLFRLRRFDATDLAL